MDLSSNQTIDLVYSRAMYQTIINKNDSVLYSFQIVDSIKWFVRHWLIRERDSQKNQKIDFFSYIVGIFKQFFQSTYFIMQEHIQCMYSFWTVRRWCTWSSILFRFQLPVSTWLVLTVCLWFEQCWLVAFLWANSEKYFRFSLLLTIYFQLD